MKKFLPKAALIALFLLLSASWSKAQSTYSYKGMYVYGIDTILSDATGNAENILFRYCRDSSFNAITISVGCLNLNTSPSYTTKLAAFIKKGRTRYGIKYFSAVVSDYTTLLTEVHPFQITRTDSLEKFNHYNFEFEYWNDANYLPTKSYCVNYLTPGGYTCDSVGAWSYFSKNMKRVDSLAFADGIKSTVYIGVSSKDTLKNRFVANTVDLVMLACYNADTTKLFMGHTVGKLTAYAKANHKVDLLPIFASLTKSAAENLKQYLIGPAPQGKHSEASPMGIFMREYNSSQVTAAIRNKINIVGYKWFKYGGMPKDSTNTAINAVPTNIAAAPSSTSALLSWNAVAGATAYRIMYAKANTYNFTTVTCSSNSYTLNGLLANTAYQFLVYSVVIDKTSASSALVSFTTTAAGGACALPSGLSSASITDALATLNWTAVSGASSYNIQYRIVGAAAWIATTSATTTKSLTGLTASSNYEFQVQANCGSGNLSAFTASSNFTTTAIPCTTPTALSSSNITTNSATVGAAAVANATGYNIQYRIVGAATWIPTSSAAATKSLTGLTASSSYEFQQQAVCPTNTSNFTASSNFSTPAPPCNVPSGLSSSAVTDVAATLSWTAVSGATSYAIQYRIVGASTWQSATSATATKNITGLTASSAYEFQVQTVCSASNSSAFSSSSNFNTAAPPCNVATGLSSSLVTDNSATVSWTAVSGATGYNIQYRVTGTSIWLTASSATASKALSGLSASSTYEFQVQTVCSASNTSAFSSSSTFSTPAPPCNVPTGLSSASITSNSAILSWTAFAGASSYTIQYRVVGAASWVSSSSAVTSNSLSGLTPNSNYEFQVKSVCSVSNSSAFSSSSTFSTPAPPCNTPTGLASASVTHNSATVSWTAISGATAYNVNYRVVGAATWLSTTSATSTKNILGLTAASNYEFQIQSDCGSGNTSSFSSSATFTTLATPCALPTGLSTTALTYNSVTLNWNSVSAASAYSIQYRVVGASSWTSISSATNSKGLSGLNSSTNYEFQVQSDCGGGNISAYTASATFTTPAPPCNLVTGLAASAVTENSATLGWVDFAGASGYNVKYRTVGAATWISTTSAINSKSIAALTASSNYEFQIQSDCGAGNTSAFTASGTFTTLAPPCNTPTGLSPTAVSNNSASLNWNTIAGANGYLIQYRIVGSATWTSISSATNTYNLTGLSANTTYEFGVQSTCAANSSAFAAATSFATSAPPCNSAVGLTANSLTNNSATLSWTAVSGAANYNVQYRVVGTSVWLSATSAGAGLVLTGLSASSTYEFQVQTECSSGNTSTFTSSSTFSTTAPPCLTPSGLSSSSVTDNSVALSWANNAGAFSYNIQYRIIGTATWISTTSAVNMKNCIGLSPVSNYEFQVQADCGAGNTSAFSSSSNFTTLAPPCNIPTGLSSSAITDNSVSINWTAVSGAASYNLQYRIVGTASWNLVACAGNSKNLSGLTASSAYEFQIQTVCTYGNTSAFTISSNFTTAAPPCSMPSGLSSASVTYNSANINWTNVAEASAYNVRYRIVGAATWISSTSATNTKSLTSLLPSSNYEFQIQSDCGSGNTSAYSATADFFTPAAPCNIPSSLSSSAITFNSATLNWVAVAGVSAYNVKYRIVGSATWSSTTSATNSKSISGLTAASNYEFQVQSDCGNSNVSAFTASANFATPAPPCDAPTSLSSSGITSTSAALNWIAYAGASSYTLKYRIIGAAAWSSLTSSTTSATISGLTPSSNYEFKIQSDCGSGNLSAFSTPSTFVTPAPPCITPGGLSVSSITYNSASLNWTAVAGVTNYTIQYREVGAAAWTTSASASISKTITGLNSASNYEFQVQSDCGSGNYSSYSSPTSFSTPAPPCNTPGGLVASAISDVSASFDWIDFSGAVGYNIRYRITGTASWTSATSVLNTLNVSGLTPASNYEFQVQSNCGSGNTSAYSGSANFSTIAPPCNVPTGLTSSAVTNTSATLTWNAISGASSYVVQYRTIGAAAWLTLNSPVANLNLSALSANSTYEFEVQSVCSASSSSAFSFNSTFATSAPPCNAAAGLAASGITNDAATLSWTAVATASNYNVQYRLVGTPVWSVLSSANNNVVITALNASSNYEFQVQTECSSGNTSPFTSPVNFTTLAPPCDVPYGLSASSITDNSVTLNWNNFSGALSYNLQYRVVGSASWISATSAVNTLNVSGLNGASVYEFQVQSVCGSGNNSLYSPALNFTTLAPPCNVPNGLGTSSVTYNSANLNWNAVSGDSSYTFRYRKVGTASWSSGSDVTNSSVISGLIAASNYEFQVQSNCGNSINSAFSASSTFTTLAAPCAVPQGLTSSALTYNSATINWTSVSGAIGYSIQYRAIGAASWTTTTSTSASKNLAGLNASQAYEFEVASDCGNANTSAFSQLANFTTLAAPCLVPGGLNAVSNSPTDATLSWTSVSGATAYSVRYRIMGAASWLFSSSNTNSVYLPNLAHSSTYEYQIQSDCGGGNTSAFSASSTFATAVPPCSIPSSAVATNITYNSAVLDWVSVSGAASYNVKYRIVGSPSWISVSGGSSSSYSLNGLNASENYEFQIQTVCQTGISSAFSTTAQFMTDIAPCNIPTGLAVSGITSNTANLNWSSYVGASSYNVQYRAVGAANWITQMTTSTSLTITNLLAATAYQFQVESSCSATNTSGFGVPVSFTTLALPCLAPAGLSANSVTATAADLSWIAPSNATSYAVSYRLNGSSSWINLNSATSFLAVSNLTPSSTYEFQVQSVCTSGSSAFSSISTFSTSNPSCAVPQNLGASNASVSSATVSWDGVVGASNYLVEYRVAGTSIWTSQSNTATSAVLNGLFSSSTYEFHVQSTCSNSNTSAFSNVYNFVTSNPPCQTPSNLTSSAATSNSVMLGWGNVANASQYNVHYRTSGASAWIPMTASTTSQNLLGLTAGTIYEFQVQADCGYGESSFSNSSNFATSSASSACDTASGLFASSIKSTSAKLNWNPVSGAASYKVQYRKSDASIWVNKTTSFTNKSITSLSPNTEYQFKVQTNCATSSSAFTTPFLFKTAQSLLSAKASTSYNARAIHSALGITINWTASSEEDVAFYSIERSEDNVEFEPLRNLAASGNSTFAQDYEFNDLEMKLSPINGTVWYRLSMTDSKGNITYLRTIEVTQINEFEDVFKVYPNPTTEDNINLTIKLDHHEEMLVVLMDILGNQIYSKVVVTDDNGFAASGFNPGKDLKPGIYEIVGYSSKRQMSKKLIIR